LRHLYTLILFLLVPYALLRLLYLSLRNPKYRKRWPERFGFIPPHNGLQNILWIHAVSVGEVNATRPLVELLKRDYSDYGIVITTMTPTGADTVLNLYGHSVTHFYVPYDLPAGVCSFMKRVRPTLLLVMETELWPNLYHYCNKFNIPIIIANARMSGKSFRGYMRFRKLVSNTLQKVSLIAAQTREDANRFEQLGGNPARIEVVGNMKFDIQPEIPATAELEKLRADFTRGRPVWIAASTHDREEEIIISAYKQVLSMHPDCLLILAPRHPERFDKVAELSTEAGLRTARKSNGITIEPEVQVFILDTLGELPLYYALSDLAFVGGSLVPAGGHNMLEPASQGLPIITGPYKHNFTEISDRLEACGAVFIVNDETGLVNIVNQLVNDRGLRSAAGKAGRQLVVSGRGSSQRLMHKLTAFLAKSATS